MILSQIWSLAIIKSITELLAPAYVRSPFLLCSIIHNMLSVSILQNYYLYYLSPYLYYISFPSPSKSSLPISPILTLKSPLIIFLHIFLLNLFHLYFPNFCLFDLHILIDYIQLFSLIQLYLLTLCWLTYLYYSSILFYYKTIFYRTSLLFLLFSTTAIPYMCLW